MTQFTKQFFQALITFLLALISFHLLLEVKRNLAKAWKNHVVIGIESSCPVLANYTKIGLALSDPDC